MIPYIIAFTILSLILSTLALALDVCPYTDNHFHIISTPSNITDGANICQQFGWEYAIVHSVNWEDAAAVIMNCTVSSVGIRSYWGNQLSDPSCQYMQASGVFGLATNASTCTGPNVPMLPILCQDLLAGKHADGAQGAIANEMKAGKIKKSIKQEDFTICEYTERGLHMMFGPYEQAEAASVCSNNNWSLAQLGNNDDINAMHRIWQQCQPMDATAWIDSLDGINRGLCRFVYYQNENAMWLMVSEGDHPCTIPSAMIICRE